MTLFEDTGLAWKRKMTNIEAKVVFTTEERERILKYGEFETDRMKQKVFGKLLSASTEFARVVITDMSKFTQNYDFLRMKEELDGLDGCVLFSYLGYFGYSFQLDRELFVKKIQERDETILRFVRRARPSFEMEQLFHNATALLIKDAEEAVRKIENHESKKSLDYFLLKAHYDGLIPLIKSSGVTHNEK